jgi:hypothetical protein
MTKLPTAQDEIWFSGEYLGEHYGYQLFRTKDGFIEGYKGAYDPKKAKGSLDRIVTNTKDIAEFPKFITKTEKPVKRYDPHKDPKQFKIE